MAEDEQNATKQAASTSSGEMKEEEIDRNLEESFPASDPPSWTVGTDHRTEIKDEQRDQESDSSKPG